MRAHIKKVQMGGSGMSSDGLCMIPSLSYFVQLEEMRKNEDPRLSFSTPEFKEAQRMFSDGFKVMAGCFIDVLPCCITDEQYRVAATFYQMSLPAMLPHSCRMDHVLLISHQRSNQMVKYCVTEG